MPLVLIMFSSLIFTAVTFGFGFRINRITGEMIIDNVMEDDEYIDDWSYDPMVSVWSTYWRYYCMAGYFASIIVFTWCWFDWMKKNNTYEK